MIIKFSVGSKCALMLPRKLINEQLTPAKGLVINKLVDSRSLILVEEVWQFKGFPSAPLTEKVFSSGSLRHHNWGWQEVPNLFANEEDYLVLPAQAHNLMDAGAATLEAMIKKSVADFKRINNLI